MNDLRGTYGLWSGVPGAVLRQGRRDTASTPWDSRIFFKDGTLGRNVPISECSVECLVVQSRSVVAFPRRQRFMDIVTTFVILSIGIPGREGRRLRRARGVPGGVRGRGDVDARTPTRRTRVARLGTARIRRMT